MAAAAAAAAPRWIGFDMDECIGSVMPLYQYVIHATEPHIRQALIKHILAAEFRGDTWLIRPAFLQILYPIWMAYTQKWITGCFILSNNTCEEMVAFVRDLANACIGHAMQLATPPTVFAVSAGLHSASRGGRHVAAEGVKDYAVVAALLRSNGWPVPRKEDILYFDDTRHKLHLEIPHYIHVPPYVHYTSYGRIQKALAPLQRLYGGADRWAALRAASRRDQTADRRDADSSGAALIFAPQRAADALREYTVFQVALLDFFSDIL